MLKRTLGILMVLGMVTTLMIVACNPQDNGVSERVPVKPSSMFFERAYNFCSERIQDRFLIGYFGEELLENEVHFYVVCHRGDTIFHETWPATAFLGPLADSSVTDSVRIAGIQAQMQALVDGTAGPEGQVVQDSLQELFDLGPVFHYSVAGQPPKSISYSHKQKGVVVL